MSLKTWLYTIIALLLSSLVFFIGGNNVYDPQEVYNVYLDGKSIGLIKSKLELERYIDREEEYIKEKYNVDKVYIPNNLDIVKEITYNDKIYSAQSIYEEIKDKSAFTIKGYVITIKGGEEMTEDGTVQNEDMIINVLDKQVFIDAINNTIGAFVDEDAYQDFLNDRQEEITDTGSIIQDVYIQNDILIKESNISTKDQIFLTSEDLSKYLLFGTLEEQEKYTVKPGDTIESVSYNNKLSVGEFLIANEEFTSADNLLYTGQQVTLGIIKPAVKVVEDDYVVTVETANYDIVYEDDDNLAIGIEIIKQKGENGINRVTRQIITINGDIKGVEPISSEEIKPTVTQIVIRGQKYISSVGNPKVWRWPTANNYVISSPFGWRWGKFHQGLDISGCGYGSPIYAANNGVVETASYTDTNGNYIIINHNNGYKSVYAHMAYLNVKQGQIVEAGQVIGGMGETGYAFGVHLHFSIYLGEAFFGTPMNPLQFY